MNYLLTLLITVTVLVISTATLNWTVDPAELYRASSFGKEYADALLTSEHGLLTPSSLDDREVKGRLAMYSGKDRCIVIGSSHVMPIGSSRKHRSFPVCESILNLGVSGASIEDHVVLTWLSLTAGKPQVLVLGIDPWTLAFGKDERWKVRYADQYSSALLAIEGKQANNKKSASRWSNLINAQYTRRSLQMMLNGTATPSIVAARSVDEDEGDKLAIMLPDGSHVYSAEFIASSKFEKIPAGGSTYKTGGLINEPTAIELYQRLIIWAKERGVKTALLMTPYHPNVWMLETSTNVRAMIATETLVLKMGAKLNVPVIGSFRPDITGCSSDEFYDFMHPMAACLARFTAHAEF